MIYRFTTNQAQVMFIVTLLMFYQLVYYPQFVCVNAKFFAQVYPQYAMLISFKVSSSYMTYKVYISIQNRDRRDLYTDLHSVWICIDLCVYASFFNVLYMSIALMYNLLFNVLENIKMFLIHHARILLSHPLAGITLSFIPVALAPMLSYTHELLFCDNNNNNNSSRAQ